MAYNIDDKDKRTAEEMFGFDESYSKEDLDKKYHQAVADSVNAGDTEHLSDLDAAHEALDEQFASGADFVTPESKRYLPVDVYGENISWSEKMQSWWDEKCEPISLKSAYREAHDTACEKAGIPDTTDYPAPKRKNIPPVWFRAIYKLVCMPIWRLAFAVLAVWFGISTIDGSINAIGDGIDIIFNWIGVLVVIITNFATGIFTNPIRVVLMWMANLTLKCQIFAQEGKAAKDYVAKQRRTMNPGTDLVKSK